MKTFFLIIFLTISTALHSHALIINEIMSNPVGDDGGREWIEIYNNSSSTVDITNLSISVKGGSAISVIPLSGGTIIPAVGYAIIGSTVSGTSKFLTDYPAYNGPLLKSSISLVNTGVTSLEIKSGGVSLDTVSSYTAAKEGMTYSRIENTFSVVNPTPGAENQAIADDTSAHTTETVTTSQLTITQASVPNSDIILYLPSEKTVVAGAESLFSVFGLTLSGKAIDRLTYTWAYGDGGQAVGSSTSYRYVYPGRYIVTVEGGNGNVLGVGRMNVRVVAPDISIKSFSSGKYGSYIDIENPNPYELDLSQWRLVIDGASFSFPKNTFIAGNNITHITGIAMGFASTTSASSTVVKILFPNLEEVTRFSPAHDFMYATMTTPYLSQPSSLVKLSKQVAQMNTRTQSEIKNKYQNSVIPAQISISKVSSTTRIASTVYTQKDTRIVSFLKSFFSEK